MATIQSPELLDKAVATVMSMVENMGEEAIRELMGGYEGDIDTLLDSMVDAVYQQMVSPEPARDVADISSMPNINESLKEELRCQSMNYFALDILGGQMEFNWHHFAWGEHAVAHPLLGILAARDHGKSWWWSNVYPLWRLYRYRPNMGDAMRKGFMITHKDDKAADSLNLVKNTILNNDRLRDKLLPIGMTETFKRHKWNDSTIETKNSCILMAHGLMTGMRGFHPAWMVCDDMLKENIIYSAAARDKMHDLFFGAILGMVVPGGQTIVVGTPFHAKDIYGDISIMAEKGIGVGKLKWAFYVYPALLQDGTPLWPSRYSLDTLNAKRAFSGKIIFSREYLCKPVSSESTLFPWPMLSGAIQHDYKMVNNIEAFPIKFTKVVSGHDFAKSANVGADYTVYQVWGIDENECMWLIHSWRKLGASFNEQVNKLRSIYNAFRPDVMVLESNNFQSIYSEVLQNTGMPVVPHHTGTGKHDLLSGVPSLAILFERNKIKLPAGDEASMEQTSVLLDELASITFTDDKGIQGVGSHDDSVMCMWLSRRGAGGAGAQGLRGWSFM